MKQAVTVILTSVILFGFAVPFFPSASATASFPTVVSSIGNSYGSGTSYIMNLPSGESTGDMYILCVTFNIAETTDTWPTGWVLMFAPVTNGVQFECRYHLANMTEGGAITVTVGSSAAMGYVGYLISGQSTIVAPVAAIPVTGNTANPDPPSLTAIPSDARLWIAAYGWGNTGSVTHSAYPSGFTNNQVLSGTVGNARGAFSSNNTDGTTLNPGTATLSNTILWIATTISVPSLTVTTVVASPNFTLSWIFGILIILLTLLGFARAPAALFLSAILCILLSVELFNQIGNLVISAIIMGMAVFLLVIGISEVRE